MIVNSFRHTVHQILVHLPEPAWVETKETTIAMTIILNYSLSNDDQVSLKSHSTFRGVSRKRIIISMHNAIIILMPHAMGAMAGLKKINL